MDLPAQLFAYSGDLLQARAWTAVAHGNLPTACEFLEDAVTFGQTTGDVLGQATALHGLARLGHARRVVPRLTSLVAGIDGDLFTARAAHARALARRDAQGLRSVSAAFEDMGALLLAAEAAAAEASVLKRAHDDRKATAARRRAHALSVQCEGAATPALRELGGTIALTGAERRAAQLACMGRSNREIAEEFHLSVRTVEHQLQSVYAKLGISRREDLAEALAANSGESAR
jgi:DNA-binding CsgD family transcriptional regulator